MSRDDYEPPPLERATWPGELLMDVLVCTLGVLVITAIVIAVVG